MCRVFPSQVLSRFRLGVRCWNGDWDVLYWDCRYTLPIHNDGSWNCRFTLAIRLYMMGFVIVALPWQLLGTFVRIWDLPFYLAFEIFVLHLSYLEPSSGAACDTAVIDTGLRTSGVSCVEFPLEYRGIIVPERCSSAQGCS